MFEINVYENRTNESNSKLAEEEFEKLYAAPTEIVVLLSIFYGVISIIAIVGNTLVIWVVTTTRQMHTVTNMYIANLAFADVIIGMFCIPFQFQAALLQTWHLPEFMCAFCPFIQVVSVNVSVFTLTAIAVDRHRAIINPLRARPTRFISKMIIFGIWVAAFSFAIPCAIAFRVEKLTERYRKDDVMYNITRPFCENINLSDEQLQTYRYYLVFVQYVVPFCVISFVYIQMAVRLWGSRTPGNAQDARDITLMRNKKKVIKMLIIVVVVFGICWLPLQTYNILYVTWSELNEYQFINIIWFCCDWLAMSNSCYNPFIYGIYNEKFKREFNKRFSVCFCKFATNGGGNGSGGGNGCNDRTTSVHTRASSLRSNYGNTSTRIRNTNQLQLNTNCIFNRGNCTISTTSSPASPLILRNDSDGGSYCNDKISINDLKLHPIEFIINTNGKKLNKISGNENIHSNNPNNKNQSIILSNNYHHNQRKAILTNNNVTSKSSTSSSSSSSNSTIMDKGNCKDLVILSYNKVKKRGCNGHVSCSGDEIGDGLRKHKGRIIDTNRNNCVTNSNKVNLINNCCSNNIDSNFSRDIAGPSDTTPLELNEISINYPLLIRENNLITNKNENCYYNL